LIKPNGLVASALGWLIDPPVVSLTELTIVGLWSFIGIHRCYNFLQHNELALSIN